MIFPPNTIVVTSSVDRHHHHDRHDDDDNVEYEKDLEKTSRASSTKSPGSLRGRARTILVCRMFPIKQEDSSSRRGRRSSLSSIAACLQQGELSPSQRSTSTRGRRSTSSPRRRTRKVDAAIAVSTTTGSNKSPGSLRNRARSVLASKVFSITRSPEDTSVITTSSSATKNNISSRKSRRSFEKHEEQRDWEKEKRMALPGSLPF
jgi:hypothetical protein